MLFFVDHLNRSIFCLCVLLEPTWHKLPNPWNMLIILLVTCCICMYLPIFPTVPPPFHGSLTVLWRRVNFVPLTCGWSAGRSALRPAWFGWFGWRWVKKNAKTKKHWCWGWTFFHWASSSVTWWFAMKTWSWTLVRQPFLGAFGSPWWERQSPPQVSLTPREQMGDCNFRELAYACCNFVHHFTSLLCKITIWDMTINTKHGSFLLSLELLRVVSGRKASKDCVYELAKLANMCVFNNLIGPHNYMVVSLNGGTPKSSILIGFSIINHPFWGIPIFGNIHI